jgi:flagellar biosynthesis/type III secretory pathway protein FliH
MMRRLSAHDAALVVPLNTSESHAADVAQVRTRLVQARARSEARAELETMLRERVRALLHTLVPASEAEGEARFVAMFEAELARVRAASTLHVRVHPRWLSLIRQQKSWQALEATGVSLLLEPDADLGEQDAFLYSELGEIDALLDTRIAALVEALFTPGAES